MKTFRKPNEQLFSQWAANQLTKNMKTYIKRQQHKSIKHQDIKQKEAPQKFASESEWFTSVSPN